MIARIDGKVEVVEAAVAFEHYLSVDLEVKVVEITVVFYRELHLQVGVVDVAAFHVGEELLVEMILEFMSTYPEALQRQFEC